MKKINLFLINFITLISLVTAQPTTDYCGFGSMMNGTYGYGSIFGWAFGILVIVALILLIFWLIKQIQKK